MKIKGVAPVTGSKIIAGPVKPAAGRTADKSRPAPLVRPVAYDRSSLIGHHRMGPARGRPHILIKPMR